VKFAHSTKRNPSKKARSKPQVPEEFRSVLIKIGINCIILSEKNKSSPPPPDERSGLLFENYAEMLL
jgi:hypothetical protein